MKHKDDLNQKGNSKEGRRRFLLHPFRGVFSPVAATEAPARRHGRIGLGTWKTQADFREVHVVQARKVLYDADFANDGRGWPYSRGEWLVMTGAYRQLDLGEDRRAYAGDVNWTDYTLTLQARKLGGQEGFLIFFHVRDARNYCVWAVGGEGNTRAVLVQQAGDKRVVLAPEVPCRVVADRWYGLKVSVTGARIRCWLDGKIVHNVVVEQTSSMEDKSVRK